MYYDPLSRVPTLPVDSLERWISSQVYYIDVEERLYDIAKNLVINKFGITPAEEVDVSQPVSLSTFPMGRAKRVHKFDGKTRNEVISYTRYEPRVVIKQFVTGCQNSSYPTCYTGQYFLF